MILVDANLLIYAVVAETPDHGAAAAWFEDAVATQPRVGLPWMSLLAFVRITTNPRLFPNPLAGSEAMAYVGEWLALPSVWTPQPTGQHADVLARLLEGGNASGNLVMDAHLAALALEHGLVLCSRDRDFARFPDLRWEDPLRA